MPAQKIPDINLDQSSELLALMACNPLSPHTRPPRPGALTSKIAGSVLLDAFVLGEQPIDLPPGPDETIVSWVQQFYSRPKVWDRWGVRHDPSEFAYLLGMRFQILNQVSKFIQVAQGSKRVRSNGTVVCPNKRHHSVDLHSALDGDIFFRCRQCGITWRSIEYLYEHSKVPIKKLSSLMQERGFIVQQYDEDQIRAIEQMDFVRRIMKTGRSAYRLAVSHYACPRMFGDWAVVSRSDIERLLAFDQHGNLCRKVCLHFNNEANLFARAERNMCGRITVVTIYSGFFTELCRIRFEPHEMSLGVSSRNLTGSWANSCVICHDDERAALYEDYFHRRDFLIPVFCRNFTNVQLVDIGNFTHIYWDHDPGQHHEALAFERQDCRVEIVDSPQQVMDQDGSPLWPILLKDFPEKQKDLDQYVRNILLNRSFLPRHRHSILYEISRHFGLDMAEILEMCYRPDRPGLVGSPGLEWRIMDGQYCRLSRDSFTRTASIPYWKPVSNFMVQPLAPMIDGSETKYIAILSVEGRLGLCCIDLTDSSGLMTSLRQQAQILGLPLPRFFHVPYQYQLADILSEMTHYD